MLNVIRISATAVILVFVASQCVAQTTLSQPDLREFTERQVRTKAVQLGPPHIDFGTRYYSADLYSGVPPVADSPYQRSIVEQYAVASIRLYRNTSTQRTKWTPVLQQAETVIQEMLDVENNTKMTADMKSQALDSYHQTITYIYHTFLSGIARELSLEDRVSTRTYSEMAVLVLTSPQNARLSYMDAGTWELYYFATHIKHRIGIPEPEWTTPSAARISGQPSCKYWIRITWPDNRSIRELVTLSDAAALTFTPNGIVQHQ